MKVDILQKVDRLDITEKTKENIIRKSDFVDNVQFDASGSIPLFSWIDISLTELCNRVCTFCPRVDASFYPNQNLHFSVQLAEKIANELKSIDYKGGVVFCGYGEPLLHPKILDIVKAFGGIHQEIVTNGDKLTPSIARALFDSGLTFMCVSMYDGPEQVDYFTSLFSEAGISESQYILRDRWHSDEDSFGLKLTNRSGTLKFGPNPAEFKGKPCFYPAYSMAIDWNGDVLLCVQDWNKKVKFGNLATENIESVWRSLRVHKYRRSLMNGSRDLAPCNVCNADGTLHGFNHVNEWMRIENAK